MNRNSHFSHLNQLMLAILFVVCAMGYLSGAAFAQAANQINGDLQLWWKFDESGNATAFADGSGHDRTGNCANACPTSGQVGQIGQAVFFNAGSTTVSGPLATNATDNVSLAVWVKWSGSNGRGQTLLYNGVSFANGYGIYLQSNGNISVLAGGIGFADSSVPLSINRWQHVAAIRENGTWQLYVDGARAQLTGNPAPAIPMDVSLVGNDNGGQNGFLGYIDDARIYDRVLSPSEVMNLAKSNSYNSAEKCTTPEGGKILIVQPLKPSIKVDISIENVMVSNITSEGCSVTGTLRVILPGNNLTTNISGNVDSKNHFFSTTVGKLTFNIAGMTLNVLEPDVHGNGITLKRASIVAPAELGGGAVDLRLPPVINPEGLKMGDDIGSVFAAGALNLPTLKVPSGLQLFGLFADIVSESDGYKLVVSGKLWIPYMKLQNPPTDVVSGADVSGATYIAASFSIFQNAQHEMVIQVQSAQNAEPVTVPVNQVMAPQQPQATANCYWGKACLGGVSLYLNVMPGINLDQGYAGGTIWLTGVRGTITLTAHDTRIELGITIQTSTLALPVLGTAISVSGDAGWQFAPELGLSLSAAMKFFIFDVANAQVSYYESKGLQAAIDTMGLGPVPMRYEGEVRVWGSQQAGFSSRIGETFVTSSGRAGWYINPGQIYQSCSDVPCGLRWCSKWIWFFGWREAWYPCGINYCHTCLSIPPERTWLAGGEADAGRFRNNIWGIKGSVHFLSFSTGVFYDFVNKSVALGNVDGYVLDAPTILAARARYLAAQQVNASNSRADTATSMIVAAPDDHTLILSAPTGKHIKTPQELSAMREAIAANAVSAAEAGAQIITSTQVLTQSDSIFSITSLKPLTVSLFVPTSNNVPVGLRGAEITEQNYTSFAPDLRIAYQEKMTYTLATGQPQSRWRYMSATLMPVTVTVKLDGQAMLHNVMQSPEYISVTAGSHLITILPEGGGGLQLSVTIPVDSDVTILSYDNNGSLAARLLVDDRMPPSILGKGKVRFVNTLVNRSDALKLFVDGTLRISNVAQYGVSPYVEVATGNRLIEVKDAANTTVITTLLTIQDGDNFSMVASSQPVDIGGGSMQTYSVLWSMLENVHTPVTQQEFVIDQAPIGNWQVKLDGEVNEPSWSLAVLNTANPPLISNFVMDASDPSAVDLALTLHSDYVPTRISFFVAPGNDITHTSTLTNPDGTSTTGIVPVFHGQLIEIMTVTEQSLLNGSNPIELQLDLSDLESGEYYLWAQVEDGVSPSVNQYAVDMVSAAALGDRTVRIAAADFDPQVQYAGAAHILIDHSAGFATHFASAVITPELDVEIYYWDNTACPTPQNDPACQQDGGEWGKWVFSDYFPLYVEWSTSQHHDMDGYMVEIKRLGGGQINATQTYTVGDSAFEMYDDEGNFTGEVGYFGLTDIQANSQYQIRVGARDSRTQLISWSAVKTITIPLGSFGVSAPAPAMKVLPGGTITSSIQLTMSDDLFHEVYLEVDYEDLPEGISVDFVTDQGQLVAAGGISPLGRNAPDKVPATSQEAVFVTASQTDGGTATRFAAQQDATQTIPVAVSVAADTPDGVYAIPIVAIAGEVEQQTSLTVTVGNGNPQHRLYLPVVSR